MDMTGFRTIPAGMGIRAPATAPWTAIEFAFVFAMWAVMMVGMMAPSAAPMILIYARVGRQGKADGKPVVATGWFATDVAECLHVSASDDAFQWATEEKHALYSRIVFILQKRDCRRSAGKNHVGSECG
jgi:predicted metal-binding membrane protein